MRGRTGAEPRSAASGEVTPSRRVTNVAPPSSSPPAKPRRRSSVAAVASKGESSTGHSSTSSAVSPRSTASSPAGGTASRRTRSPVFWGATSDAPLFAGPLGEVIGAVPEGAVLLEAARHRDVFGGWWIGARCEDGTLGWVAYSDGLDDADDGETALQTSDSNGATSAGAPRWQRLYDTRATPVAVVDDTPAPALRPGLPNTDVDWRSVVPTVPAAEMAQLTKAHFLFADTELYEYYWSEVQPTQRPVRDWNWSYQAAVERHWLASEFTCPLTTTSAAASPATPLHDASAPTREELADLLAEFQAEVERCVVRICHETVVPRAARTVPSHPRYPDTVYYGGGILLRRCVDTADGALGGDEAAAKVGLAVYRHCAMLAVLAPRHVLHIPLHGFCTFGGFSFLCSSIPPYDGASLVHADAAVRVSAAENKANTPPLVTELLRGLGETLKFEDGAVPVEWRVYAGRDRRLYLAQTQRLVPPVLPLPSANPGASPTAVIASATASAAPSEPRGAAEGEGATAASQRYSALLQCGVRPEMFFGWPAPWPANECVRWAAVAESGDSSSVAACRAAALVSASYAAGLWIKSEGITKVAGTLGFQFPVSAPTMPTATCNACEAGIDADELRFVTCASAARCCRVCMHCYTRLVLQDNTETTVAAAEPLARTLAGAVRCGAECRMAGSFIMEPSVTELMHANGLGLRYLAYVLHRLPQPTRLAVEHVCHVELVARAAKQLLQHDLRGATSPSEARAACDAFLTALLQPSGALSERFWRTRLGPALQSRFDGLCAPFQLSRHALRLLAERVTELAGITLSSASLASMALLADEAPAAQPARRVSVGVRSAGPITPEAGEAVDDADAVSAQSTEEGPGPFIEIEHIGPRTRLFPLPPAKASPPAAPHTGAPTAETGNTAVDEEEAASIVRRRLERLLLFWIGFTPENAVDAQQPFYLDESLLQAAL